MQLNCTWVPVPKADVMSEFQRSGPVGLTHRYTGQGHIQVLRMKRAERDHRSETPGHCASDYFLLFINVCLSSNRDRGSVKKAVDRP